MLLHAVIDSYVVGEFAVIIFGVFAKALIKVVVIVFVEIVCDEFVIERVRFHGVRPVFSRKAAEFFGHHCVPSVGFVGVDEIADKKLFRAMAETNFITFTDGFEIRLKTIIAVLDKFALHAFSSARLFASLALTVNLYFSLRRLFKRIY